MTIYNHSISICRAIIKRYGSQKKFLSIILLAKTCGSSVRNISCFLLKKFAGPQENP